MKKYKHLFFDLDHTLWDYDKNAAITLQEIFEEHKLGSHFSSLEAFVNAFHHANDKLWHDYNHGRVDKEHIRKNRFKMVLKGRKVDDEVARSEQMSSYFLHQCASKGHLIDHTIDLLEYLAPKYEMSIITNGFDETQWIKLKTSGISDYFVHVITSESAGHRKPAVEIFDHALELSGTAPHEVLMIGDNPATDIAGAHAAGWKAVWYNPSEPNKVSQAEQIRHLSELRSIL